VVTAISSAEAARSAILGGLMNESTQSLAQVKVELLEKIDGVDRKVDAVHIGLLEKIDGVDRKVDAVDRKVDAVRVELLEKIDGVDRKVDAVDRKVDAVDRKVDGVRVELLEKIDQTREDLSTLIAATATALEHRVIKAVETTDEAAADRAVQRVVGTVHEWSRYDAAVVDDKLKSIERKLDDHISNETIHHTHGPDRR
jgi:hypothetical protein